MRTDDFYLLFQPIVNVETSTTNVAKVDEYEVLLRSYKSDTFPSDEFHFILSHEEYYIIFMDWFSEKLEDCPPISNWANAIENITLAGTEVHTSTTNIHAVSRRKVDRSTVSRAKDITQETSRITANTTSPHINRRVSPSQIQSQRTKRTTTQPAKPTPPPSYQKPIIQTTSNTQPNTAGWLAGFGGIAAILIFICFIAAMIWLANQ